MGVVSAVLVGPCMTAPLAGALLYIANSGDATVGGLALLALGLGMGVPLLVVGSVGAQLLPKPGAWMNAVKTVFGFVLLATALWMLSRVLPASIMLGLWGALALAAGVTLWYAAGRHVTAPTVRSIGATTAGLLLGLWGALMVVGAAGGAQDAWRPLAFVSAGSGKVTTGAPAPGDHFQTVDEPAELHRAVSAASTAGRWTVVDFYADWCVSCKVIDKTVFGDPKVQQALAQATLLRPDVTDDDAASRQLLREFNILGPPTILFISPDGTEQRAARVVGELSADDFLGHWRRARGVRATEAAPEAAP
jgi:thiol:disulfide interchange protein DsbD